MYDSIQNLAHELRLFGVHAAIERRCQEALAENMHPSEVVRLLLQDEKDKRREMAAKRLKTRANFRSTCALEDWDFTKHRGITKAKFKELALLNFYYKKQNLIIVGPTGVGKTHLAIALGHRLCQDTVSTAFFSANLFLEEVAAEKAAGRYLKFLRKIAKTPVIILDDFALRSYTHEEANIFLELLEERYQKTMTIITSQVSPQGWRSLFDDAVISQAIVDRLENPSELVTLDGDSFRKNLKGIDEKIGRN